jgi:hypothetical protein
MLTAVKVLIVVLWVVAPASSVGGSQHFRPRTDTCNGTSNVTCNVVRILRLDVTAIIACNACRIVRRDPSAGGFFLEHKGFGLGSQYTFGRLFSVYACVDVCS